MQADQSGVFSGRVTCRRASTEHRASRTQRTCAHMDSRTSTPTVLCAGGARHVCSDLVDSGPNENLQTNQAEIMLVAPSTQYCTAYHTENIYGMTHVYGPTTAAVGATNSSLTPLPLTPTQSLSFASVCAKRHLIQKKPKKKVSTQKIICTI